MSDTERALLAAIIENPDDDLPRLMLADEIELAEPERAEFIRVQCELARMEESGEPCEIDPEQGHTCAEYPCPVCTSVEKYGTLSERESHLVLKHLRGWLSLPEDGHVAAITDVRFVGIDRTYYVRRGFVEAISCDLRTFAGGPCEVCRESGHLHRCRTCHCLWAEYPPDGTFPQGSWSLADEYQTAGACCDNTSAVLDLTKCKNCSGTGRTPGVAPALFAAQPVTRVTLTDREPMDGPIIWQRGGGNLIDQPYRLPSPLFNLLGQSGVRYIRRGPDQIEYLTRRCAEFDLSNTCVAWGRSVAEGHWHGVCEACEGYGKPGHIPETRQTWAGWRKCPACDGTGKRRGLPPL